MKFDQIAYYAHNHTDQHRRVAEALLGTETATWTLDMVTGLVTLPRRGIVQARSVGHLRFNYDLGIELEVLTYLEGPHWHEFRPEFGRGVPFVSHHGIHLEPGEDFPSIDPTRLVQEMWTTDHTNPYLLKKGRKYQYRIYDFMDVCGAFIKYIKRIEQ